MSTWSATCSAQAMSSCSGLLAGTVVGVLSDEAAAMYKRRPIMSLSERVAVIEACRFVDEVIPDAPLRLTADFLVKHDLDLVVHGDDVSDETASDVYGPAVEQGLFRRVPRSRDLSTTELIARVRSRRAWAQRESVTVWGSRTGTLSDPVRDGRMDDRRAEWKI
jgi:glycerol-3-phosphate cytidylyltransferase-like family protein